MLSQSTSPKMLNTCRRIGWPRLCPRMRVKLIRVDGITHKGIQREWTAHVVVTAPRMRWKSCWAEKNQSVAAFCEKKVNVRVGSEAKRK